MGAVGLFPHQTANHVKVSQQVMRLILCGQRWMKTMHT